MLINSHMSIIGDLNKYSGKGQYSIIKITHKIVPYIITSYIECTTTNAIILML